jgi:hypothetical protein
MIVAGELDLATQKHVAKCCMAETEHSFMAFCDDPEVCIEIQDDATRQKAIDSMMEKIHDSSVLWSLAEGLFQLPAYFSHRLPVAREVLVRSGKRYSTAKKGGRGLKSNYRVVSAIEIVGPDAPAIRQVQPPHYQTETEGHWRRLKRDAVGHDRLGNEVIGRTWVSSPSKWRELSREPRLIYVKSPVVAGRLRVAEYLRAADQVAEDPKGSEIPRTGLSELYIMRCTAMQEQVYKVGWTSGSSAKRAEQLSAATGVPLAFDVVAKWEHPDAEALETDVHMLLAPYRLNDRREFFQAELSVIKRTVETAINRAKE